MKRVVALFLFLLFCMLSLTCYSESQNESPTDVSWQSFVDSYNTIKAYAPNPLDETYYNLLVGALELPIYSISVVQWREYYDAHQTTIGAEMNETLKRLNHILVEEASACYESGIYEPGVIDKVLGFNFEPDVDYVSDMTWLSTLLDEYEQEKSVRLSSESSSESGNKENAPAKGVDIIEFSTTYYSRKLKICDLVGQDFSFGQTDFCFSGSAMVDGHVCMLDENNHIKSMSIEDTYYLDMIPAIYALRDDLFMDQLNELAVQYNMPTSGYWLTSYKDDFAKIKSATAENPTQWGDYAAFYFSYPNSETGGMEYRYVFELL